MILSDAEYRRALDRLREEAGTLRAQRDHLAGLGLTPEEVDRAMQPMISFHAQLEEEVDAYTRMRRGDLGPLRSLTAIGRWLVGARIARGLTQQELAGRLGVDLSQVQRDERDEYSGVTVDRAQRVLDALGVRFTAEAESPLAADGEAGAGREPDRSAALDELSDQAQELGLYDMDPQMPGADGPSPTGSAA